MARHAVRPGAVIDGFTIGECVHSGGMATLWSVTRPDITTPLLMKVPRVAEGEDPAAIVSFEMEQMILPRLSGPHVPAFFAAGDFMRQAYVVIEVIPGTTLYGRLGELPLPYGEAGAIAGKIATALADLHRQNVIHHDIKPSSIMFRPTGEAVLIDFGLSHHNQLPDLLQEEFRIPYGTAPYMAPERLLGVRDDPRSDLFSLGVLLVFFHHGRAAVRRERNPARNAPPAVARSLSAAQTEADYPPWLQEIVLRCLEIDPVWRYPTASQLAFDLAHPDEIKLTGRAERLDRDPISTVWRRRFNGNLMQPRGKADLAAQLASGPIVMIALDVSEEAHELNEALRVTAARILATLPAARLACLNVLKLGRVTIDRTLDEEGNNKHVDRLVALRHWAQPLKLDENRLTVHVLEAIDPAAAILEFAEANHVDHIVIGARQNSLRRTLLGGVSAKVAAEAPCTVTVVRPPRLALLREQGTATENPAETKARADAFSSREPVSTSLENALDRLAARGRRGVADRGDIGLVGFHRAALEHGGAGDKGVDAGGGELAGNLGGDAAVDLDVDRPSGGHRAQIPDLAERGGDEGLAAEAGIDRHHQHEVDHVDDVFDRRNRRGRVERDAGLLAEAADRLQRAVQMRTGFRVHRDVIAAGLGEGLQIGVAGRDHQMRVEDLLAVRTHRLDDIGAKGNVGHEMPVHHVEMNPVGAGRIHGADLFAQPGKIRSQDRRRDDEGA